MVDSRACPKCGEETEGRNEDGTVRKWGGGRRHCKVCAWSGIWNDTSYGGQQFLFEWEELGIGAIVHSEGKYKYEPEPIKREELIRNGGRLVEVDAHFPVAVIVALVLGKEAIHTETETAGGWSVEGKLVSTHLC